MKVVPLKIDDRLCIGQILVGVLGHYKNDEIINNSDLQYIASVLKKKNFSLKNGSSKDRANILKANKTKNINLFNVSSKNVLISKNTWELHSHISDDAWNDAVSKLPKGTMVSAVSLMYFLLKKRKDVLKFYSFDEVKVEDIFNNADGKTTHSFQSMRTSSQILKSLEYRIANYYSKIKLHNTRDKNESIKSSG